MSDIENDSENDRKEDEEIEKLMLKMNKQKVKEVTPVIAEVPKKEKKPRKPRTTPISEATKAALAKGREKSKMNAEIKRLEKEQELVVKKKVLDKLKKEQSSRNGIDEEKENMKKQIAELKQQASQKQPPAIVQIMPAPTPVAPVKTVDKEREAYQRNLLKYAKF